MSVAKLAQAIGKRGRLMESGLAFHVEIRDVREVYGRLDYLVIPVAGDGSKWVAAERVTLDTEG